MVDKKSFHNKGSFIAVIVTVIILGLAFTGCTSSDENVKIVKSVCELTFNCPNKDLAEIFKNNISPDSLELLSEKQKEMYSQYFTENGYNSFVSKTLSSKYHALAYELNGLITVKRVEVNKKDVENYDFIVNVRCDINGKGQVTAKIEGNAQIDVSQKKISFIQFYDDEFYKTLYDMK